MDWGFLPKKKRRGVRLELAPLIDIFVMIIIFLIKGTFMGQISVAVPANMQPAISESTEGMEIAPEVFVFKDSIYLKMIDKMLSLSSFTNEGQGSNSAVVEELKHYVKNLSEQDKKTGIILNFVADASADYKSVFDVTKVLREAGFQSILFVAEGNK